MSHLQDVIPALKWKSQTCSTPTFFCVFFLAFSSPHSAFLSFSAPWILPLNPSRLAQLTSKYPKTWVIPGSAAMVLGEAWESLITDV